MRFERQHGIAPLADDVTRCVAAESHRGAMWQTIAKDDANRGKSTRELLELVAAAL
jgi:pre-mRNA-processing factor 6